MLPFCSHWQPDEFVAVFTSPGTWVSSLTVWSVTPPHCGKNGPCLDAPAVGAPVWGTSGEVGSSVEHAANTGTTAAASTANVLALRVHPVAAVLGVTPCTVAAAEKGNHRHAD
ncbi:hypothetical protein MMAGJ_02940 [Mycolicibacterium mageritense]|uniref:Uncharacterized protein n=1 Tax=Mycolicibacterium mageritense TaxID=53462 RepID=A0ABN5XYA8_MYCME|nr:hypothetical protein MMAGJ_02940 [Mycolicibacterium mageritense]